MRAAYTWGPDVHGYGGERAEMTDYPMNRSPRCGARTRGGAPCRAPALRNKKRCRLHGGWSPGAPRNELHPNFKGGKYSQEGKALVRRLKAMAKVGEVLLVRTLDDAGLSRKVPASLRRRAHVKRARAEAKKAKAKDEQK
jgi:glucans biosynthesis protein